MAVEHFAINRPVNRLDAYEKVTGKAKYGGDLCFEGMLHAKGVYAENPHARIVQVDTSLAEQLEGVVCVITAKDIPGLKVIGEVMLDQYILADDKTRFFGGGLRCSGDRRTGRVGSAADPRGIRAAAGIVQYR